MRRSGKNTPGFIKVSLIFIITLILSACSLGCEPTVPTLIPPVTSEPSSSPTAHPERLLDEVLLLVKDYLMECAETSLARDIVWMEVASLDAVYQDDVGWLVSGNGEWIVHDVAGSVEPADKNALRILQSIIDANKSESPSMVNAVSEIVSSVVQVSTYAGSGSGVIIDQAGYVLTNNHVVAGTLLATITLSSGEQCGGIVVGRDEIMDIAIVQAAANNLPVAPLGVSSKLMIGERVVSMGFPLSLGGGVSVTEGIVSAFRNDSQTEVRSIQTDAAMNPGSSGGPLINLSGEVVGINSWVIKVSGGIPIEGVNFAVAIDGIKDVLPQLMAGEAILAPVEESWETYSNMAYGYSISYPSSWQIDDQNLKYVRIHHSSYDVGLDTATVTDVSPKSKVENLVDTNIDKLEGDYPDFNLLYREEVAYGGLSGIEIAYTYTEGARWYFRHFFARAGNSMYHTRIWIKQSEYESYSVTIDRIISSFSL